MNEYEAKLERRRERLEARAARQQQQADAAFRRSDSYVAGIPPGQPILVGHHSEKRHRRALERSDNAMRKGLDLQKQAGETAARAASVGKGGISSDDPEAVAKLKTKLADMEAQRARMKAINKAHKAYLRKPESLDKNTELDEAAKHRIRTYKPAYSWEPHPHAPFELQNLGANIRRVKQRIDQLERAAEAPEAEPIQGEGFRILENKEANRVQIIFDAIPPAEIRKELKSRGFRWSRSEGAWQRHLNNAGRWAAECIKRTLESNEEA